MLKYLYSTNVCLLEKIKYNIKIGKMKDQYKYISSPYSLEELIIGNPIFKVQCEIINDLFDAGYDEKAFDSKIIETEYLELIFNEFLNILSLLLYDNHSVNETLKKVVICNNEFEMFDVLSCIIPYIIGKMPSHNIDYAQTSLKAVKYLKNESIILNKNNISSLVQERVGKVFEKYFDNLNEVISETTLQDLTNFFDLHRLNLINDFGVAFQTKSKRKVNVIINNVNKNDKRDTYDTSLQVFLFEEIMKLNNWEEISATKKGQLLSLLIFKNDTNIKKIYLELEKKNSGKSEKFEKDLQKASELINNILG